MNSILMIELIGYLGSALVVVSMLMTSVVKLRIVNTIGSAIFMGYALVIGSYPTALMNFCLIAINVYQLWRLMRDQKQYRLIETDLRDGFVSYFLDRNGEDIRKWFPEFSVRGLEGEKVCLVCCEDNPAGLFIGKTVRPGELEIVLDYATPVYRDTSVGRYLYGQLKREGYRSLVFNGNAPEHVAYMEHIGYVRNDAGGYTLVLDTLRPV